MARSILNSVAVLAILLVNACNITKTPFLASSYNSAAVPVHPSGKVHLVLGLFAWGDASIRSAKTLFRSQQGAYIIQRISIIDQEKHLLFGCGYYDIYLRGNITP